MDFLWIFVFILEITKYLLIGNIFFDVKVKRYWVIAVTAFVYAGIVLLDFFEAEGFALSIIFMIIIDLLFLLDTEIQKRITGIIKICFLSSCMDGISSIILELLLGHPFNNSVIYVIKNNIIAISVLLVVYFIKKKYVIKYDGFLRIIIYICAIIMGSSIFILIQDVKENIKNSENSGYDLSNILIIIYYLSIMSIVLFLFYENDMNRKMKKYLETERMLKDTQKKYYEAMLEKEENTRKFRHDMVNHLIYVHNLIVQNQQKEALDYIEKLQDGMRNIQQKCYYTGNSVIDSMLNHYIQLLEGNVSVSVSGNYIKEAAVSQIELCTIFSNLIKNATESLNSQKDGEKYLKVILKSGKENMKIEIINSIETSNSDNGKNKHVLPETKKKDKRNHGIGLRNVKETVEQNHGIFEWDIKEGCFKVLVVLPCKRTEK